jgi:hypothetical protein
VTLLTAAQVAGYWEGAGGPKSRAVEWAAIAMGESGFDTAAVSPVGAIGLWQIMPFNAPPYGYTPADLYDPAVNARVTVAMSGGGTNCAAWDSAYFDIGRSGRYRFLSWPEAGSADYLNLPVVAAEIGGTTVSPISAPTYPGIADTLPGAVAEMQLLAGKALPALTLRSQRARAAITAAGRPGWRP